MARSLTTPFASSRIPEFIKSDYPQFALFIQKYYEWLDDNHYGALASIPSTLNIDETDDSFVGEFFKVYAPQFPQAISGNKRQIIKLLRDLFQTKGSEVGYSQFFRMIYNQDLEIKYPKESLLKPSDGEWIQKTYIHTHKITDLSSLIGKTIIGRTSKATAFVESAFTELLTNVTPSVLELANITGTFVPSDIIDIIENGVVTNLGVPLYNCITSFDITSRGTLYSVGDTFTIPNSGGTVGAITITAVYGGTIDSVSVVNGGANYEVGDLLNFEQTPECNIAYGVVSSVDGGGAITGVTITGGGFNYKTIPSVTVTSLYGAGAVLTAHSSTIGRIKEVSVVSSGLQFASAPTVTFTSNGDGTASGTVVLGAMYTTQGKFATNRGFLSDQIKIQDGKYWQDYSYVLRTGVPINQYRQQVSTLFHVAGLAMYGEFVYQDIIDLSGSAIARDRDELEFIIEILYDGILIETTDGSDVVIDNHKSLGPNYFSFDLDKYMYTESSSTSISNFYGVVIGNIEPENIYNSFDVIPDSDLTIVSTSINNRTTTDGSTRTTTDGSNRIVRS